MESDTQDRRIEPGSLIGLTGRIWSRRHLSLSLSLSSSVSLWEHTESLTLRLRPWWLFQRTARESFVLLNPGQRYMRERQDTLTQRLLLIAGSAIKRSSFCSMFVFFYEMSCICMYFSSVCPIYCIYLSVCKSKTSYTMSYYSADIEREWNYAKMFYRHTNLEKAFC